MGVQPLPRKGRGRPRSTEKSREHAASIEEALERGDEVTSVRLQMTLRPSYAETLHKLRMATDAPSYTDVVRAALDFYTKSVLSVQRGGRVLNERPNGEREILMDGLKL
jgi:hypothetical protein